MQRRSALFGSLTATVVGILTAWRSNALAASPYLRPDITKLSESDLVVLSGAIGLMMAKSADDPSSWNFLAATHQRLPFESNKQVADVIKANPGAGWLKEVLKYIDFDDLAKAKAADQSTYWAACIHHGRRGSSPYKSGHFLSWHRVFLLNFEAHLMLAVKKFAADSGMITGISGLPYWDYYSDSTLPLVLRRPKLANGADNRLFVAYRNTQRNAITNPVGISTPSRVAFGVKDFLTQEVQTGNGLLRGFDSILEQFPHDAVHGDVGGLMGSVPTSSWDPIFWFHHANIDRLWAIWEKSGSMQDVDANWKNEPFVFFGPQGAVLRHAGDLVGAALPYTYQSMDWSPVEPTPLGALPKPPVLATQASPAGAHPFALTSPQSVAITNQGGTMRLSFPSKVAQGKLGALALDKATGPNEPTAVNVVLEGLTVTDAGRRDGFVFDVYVALPALGNAKPAEPVQIGSFNVFNLDAIQSEQALRFDATLAVKSLAKTQKFLTSTVEVIVAPRRSVGPDGKQQNLESGPALLKIRSLHLDGLANK